MKHKHSEMICAKANNTDLVVLTKTNEKGGWFEIECNDVVVCFFAEFDHFLCLPQHKEACLHWLNGGDTESLTSPRGDWQAIGNHEGNPYWMPSCYFMNDEVQIRIKPKATPLDIPWHIIKDEFKFAAMDSDSSVWVYLNEPSIRCCKRAGIRIDELIEIKTDGIDWKLSLTKRP